MAGYRPSNAETSAFAMVNTRSAHGRDNLWGSSQALPDLVCDLAVELEVHRGGHVRVQQARQKRAARNGLQLFVLAQLRGCSQSHGLTEQESLGVGLGGTGRAVGNLNLDVLGTTEDLQRV